MTKKVDTKKSVTETVNNSVTVLVNVTRNFRDATDNNRVISSGPNSYYKTNKDRADKLVAAGFCKYEDEGLEVAKVKVVEDVDTTSNTEEDNPADTEATNPSNTEEENASDDSNPNE